MEAQVVSRSNQTFGDRAKEILETRIQRGQQSAAALIERVNRDAPRDVLVKGKQLVFEPGEARGVRVGFAKTGEKLGAFTKVAEELHVHHNALRQLAERGGIHSGYLSSLADGEDWQRVLAAGILNVTYHEGFGSTRYLARSVEGQVRGFLSDRYRRLDSRPLIEAFAQKCQEIGAVPYDGLWSDTRLSLKAILNKVYEPIPGEMVSIGLEWSNSDFGNGMHAIRVFVLRVLCLNGATLENALGQVHLGRQLTDDIELSQKTYELDTQASISALQDVVRGVLAPAKVEILMAGIRQAEAKKVDWRHASSAVSKRLLKGELEEVRKAFESDDVINLPAGQSMWRMSNALSWLAGQQLTNPDRQMELQRLAGEVLTGTRDKPEDN